MIRNAVATVAVIIGAIVALLTIHPAPTATPISGGIERVAHHTDTLPACEYEDGSGQALCYWDAQTSGNGVGTSVVAGDCSVGTVYTQDASDACLMLWDVPMRYTYLSDGAVSITSEGSVLVSDCLTIAWEGETDKAIRDELIREGWTITECFKAHMP